MNIKYERCYRRYRKEGEKWDSEEVSVGRFVDSLLTRSHDNQLSQAEQNAYSAQGAVARLVGILADKKLLNLEEILLIAGRDKHSLLHPEDGESQQNHELVP